MDNICILFIETLTFNGKKMKILKLNLDPNFDPMLFLGFGQSYCTIKANLFQFSGGEFHIKIDSIGVYDENTRVVITNRFRDMNDLMKVFIAKDALERMGIKPYIPYARQDRQCAERESFSLKVFANLLNTAKFDKVIVYDAHSDVAPALIENCENLANTRFVEIALDQIGGDVILISPDSGANKKMNKLFTDIKQTHRFSNIFESLDVVKCDKKRSTVDGTLSGFEVFSDDLKGRSCLIVDDICSFGGTFKGIAKALKEKNAGKVYLFVTHYEGVAKESSFSESIEHIYKTNSMNDLESDFITCFKL